MAETETTLSLVTKLATSYVGNNKVALAEIPTLIGSVHEALTRLESGEEIREPAVPINKSVKRNEIICLECGQADDLIPEESTEGRFEPQRRDSVRRTRTRRGRRLGDSNVRVTSALEILILSFSSPISYQSSQPYQRHINQRVIRY